MLTFGVIAAALAAGLRLSRASHKSDPNTLPTMPPPSKTDRILEAISRSMRPPWRSRLRTHENAHADMHVG